MMSFRDCATPPPRDRPPLDTTMNERLESASPFENRNSERCFVTLLKQDLGLKQGGFHASLLVAGDRNDVATEHSGGPVGNLYFASGILPYNHFIINHLR